MRIKILENGAAQSLGKARAALGSREVAKIERTLNHRAHGGSGFETRILLYVGETRPLPKRNLSSIGINLTGQDSQQRRFAGPIRPNQADTISIGNSERNILKERIRSKRFRNLL